MKTFYKTFLFAIIFYLIGNAAFATVWTVQVVEFDFVNSPSSVSVGDTIRWTWGNGSHTTTSTAVPPGAATWNSPINSSNTQFDYVVAVPGSYSYQCTPHSGLMNASFTATGTTDSATPAAMENVFAVKLENNDVVNVTYSVSSTAPVSIGLYDLTGKLLKTSAKEIQSQGVYSYKVPIEDVKSGMYFVVVQIGNDRTTSKFTVR